MSGWPEERMEQLTGRFAHYCNEWDGLPIDEMCLEFGVCGCVWNPPEERAAKDAAVEAARARYEASRASAAQRPPDSSVAETPEEEH